MREQVHKISVEEYNRLSEPGIVGQRTELIPGVVVDKMGESPLLSWLAEQLADWLREGITDGWKVREGHPVTLQDSEPKPDVCVVPRDSVGPAAHPETAALAIEVAVTSEKLDHAKATVDAELEVDEYLTVLANRGCVEVHRSPRDGRYVEVKTVQDRDRLSPEGFPKLSIVVADIFPKSDNPA